MGINIEQTLLELTETCARIEAGQTAHIDRLYGEDGAIPALFRLNKERDDEHKGLVKDIGEHRNKEAWRHGITGTVTTFGTLLLKAGLSKLGLHF